MPALEPLPGRLISVDGHEPKAAMKGLNPELLGSYSKIEVLRSFVESHRKLVPPEKEDFVKDFLELSHLEFRKKYESQTDKSSTDDRHA